MIPERRSCVRHKVHGPVFASFDGVTGGFILDLSEEGMAMQTAAPVEAHRRVQLRMNLPGADYLKTTAYVAWADALGRAGVRFSELPEEARLRLDQWLACNAGSPSHWAPKFTLSDPVSSLQGTDLDGDPARQPWAISLEPEMHTSGINRDQPGLTVEYEFRRLGSDLPATLHLISERTRSLTRGTGAVIALGRQGSFLCQASVPAELCAVTTAKPTRGWSSTSARSWVCWKYPPPAPAFEESDVTLVERLAQTLLLAVRQTDSL